jgi:putative transposase
VSGPDAIRYPTAGCLDSQSVKSTEIEGVRGYHAAKQITGRKRHRLVDTLGLLMLVVVTGASVPERDGARLVFKRLRGGCTKERLIRVDGGYRGQLVGWVAEHLRLR